MRSAAAAALSGVVHTRLSKLIEISLARESALSLHLGRILAAGGGRVNNIAWESFRAPWPAAGFQGLWSAGTLSLRGTGFQSARMRRRQEIGRASCRERGGKYV